MGSAKLTPWTLEGQTQPVQEADGQCLLSGSSEGQRSPGRLGILQGNVKWMGTGHPHVSIDALAEKTRLSEQRALTGTQAEEREFMAFVRSRRKPEGCKDV